MALFIGVMSGTSVDGIDIALLEINTSQCPRIVAAKSAEFNPTVTALINDVITSQSVDLLRLGDLHMALGEAYALAVNAFLDEQQIQPHEVSALGCHGQTLFHAPLAKRPFSFQLGDPNTIAEMTGITTIADFRQRDLVCGGQGAPMVPPFHQALFHSTEQNRVIVNIGGMSNITILPADQQFPVLGFDTGPGNILMDSWIQQHQGKPYDDAGQWAATGQIDESLLACLLDDAYFRLAIPKSTGREYFHANWLIEKLRYFGKPVSPNNVQKTLVQLTCQTISDAIQCYAPDTDAVYICGGGAHNHQIMHALASLLAPVSVVETGELGLDADFVEASAFAWLAYRTFNQLPGNFPSVTGAKHPTILGGVFWANPPPPAV